jgi:hypothetical protein
MKQYVIHRLYLILMALVFTNVQAKYVGISYSNWFSTTDVDPNYITWGGAGEPIGSKVWGVPLVGYYSSKDLSVIDQHAEWLSDAGVDFVMMDLSNSGFHDLVAPAYSTVGFKPDKYWIEDAAIVFADRMAWRKNQGLPYVEIAVMIGALGNCENITNGFLAKAADIIKTWYIDNPQRNSVYFKYKGKPLLATAIIGCAVYFPSGGGGWGWGDTPLVPFDRNDFTVRHVNDHNALAGLWDPATGQSHKRLWSWGERYLPNNNPPIIPSYMADNGIPEFQIIQAGERGNGGWGGPEGRGREGGQTFKDYWSIARERDVDLAFIQSWNEWTGTEENPGEESTPEYSNDMEPSTAHGTFYLELMKEEIALFKGVQLPNNTSTDHFWSFANNSSGGWDEMDNLTMLTAESAVQLQIEANDPKLMSPDNLCIPADSMGYVHIVMKNNTSDNQAQIFWSNDIGGISEDNSYTFPIESQSQFVHYVIPVHQKASWTGEINRVRLDPVNSAQNGSVEIRSIGILNHDLLSNQEYVVLASHTGKTISLAQNEMNNGINIVQWDYLASTSQQWSLSFSNEGYYYISNKYSSKYMDVEATSTEVGGNIHQWELSEANNQKWIITKLADGNYGIKSVHSGLALEVDGDPNSANGTNIQQQEWKEWGRQKWKFQLPENAYVEEPVLALNSANGLVESIWMIYDVQGQFVDRQKGSFENVRNSFASSTGVGVFYLKEHGKQQFSILVIP